VILLLTGVWVILVENLTAQTVVTGLVISAACILFYQRFVPLPRMATIKPVRLMVYLLFLLTQVYIAGLMVIKIIFTGPQVEIVEIKTRLTDKLLRTVLVNSITLVPGSISLDLEEDKITVLWLKNKTKMKGYDDPGEFLKGKLERVLIKAQK
jgi:multicomponent Na+:H+ antiporter subunit E